MTQAARESWKRYRATTAGLSRAQELETGANPALVDALREQKRRIWSLGFLELLRKVYEGYPDFASQSIFMF